MPVSRLGKLQQAVLEKFFEREDRLFLTGGAALAGFHLGHRETNDLDLFATSDVLDEAVASLEWTARELGASQEALRTSPDFRRFLLRRSDESVVVDLVRERAAQVVPEKPTIGRLRVDPPEEILANKLCTLLSRAELRDLVDVLCLERAGFPMEAALPGAARKDAGLTPGQLAWVLSQITLGDDARPPAVSVGELRSYLAGLIQRLSRLAYPEADPPA